MAHAGRVVQSDDGGGGIYCSVAIEGIEVTRVILAYF